MENILAKIEVLESDLSNIREELEVTVEGEQKQYAPEEISAMIMAKKVNFKPLGDRVLVQSIELNEQVKGGIIIPDSAKAKPQEAKVVALGTGAKVENGKALPFNVKVGDVVIVSKYGGTEVKIDDQSYTLVREDDILGIVG